MRRKESNTISYLLSPISYLLSPISYGLYSVRTVCEPRSVINRMR